MIFKIMQQPCKVQNLNLLSSLGTTSVGYTGGFKIPGKAYIESYRCRLAYFHDDSPVLAQEAIVGIQNTGCLEKSLPRES